jgi:hypothetical protein
MSFIPSHDIMQEEEKSNEKSPIDLIGRAKEKLFEWRKKKGPNGPQNEDNQQPEFIDIKLDIDVSP